MNRSLILFVGILACSHPSDRMTLDSTVSMDGDQAVFLDAGHSDADNTMVIMDMQQTSDGSTAPEDGTITTIDVAISRDAALDAANDAQPDTSQLDTAVDSDAMAAVDMTIALDAMVSPPIEECFPDQRNGNLSAVAFVSATTTVGSEVCNADFAAELDENVAELGFSGGAPAFIDGQEVTACLRFDFGRTCALDEHVGVLISSGAVAQACNPDGPMPNQQCDVEGLCGNRPGASVLLFAGAQPESLRFLARVGNCGAGTALNSLTPINAFSGAVGLAGVRYVYACRPSVNCGADAGDVVIDGLFLIWR